jgi:hypothetical protein
MANENLNTEMTEILNDIRTRHGKDIGMRKIMDSLRGLRAEGEDRGRSRDTGYRWEQQERARDAARKFAASDEGDIEELIEELCEAVPELGSAIREAAHSAGWLTGERIAGNGASAAITAAAPPGNSATAGA